MEFIYCGHVVLTEELALDLLVAANKYALLELKARCEEFLVESLNLDVIVERVELAEKVDAMVLYDGAAAYLIQNATEVAEKIELKKLSKAFVINLLLKTMFK